MKKKYLLCLLAVLLILVAVCAFSYYYVDGTELPAIDQLSGEYTATVIKTPDRAGNKSLTYTLSSDQILALQELLLSSRFTRCFSRSHTFGGDLHDIYTIFLELYDAQGNQMDFIQIFFIEDLTFSISAPYAEAHLSLHIRNDQLDEKLDQILAAAIPDET